MKKWIYAGIALLIVQICMTLIIHSNIRNLEAFTPQANLFTFSPPEVDSIIISGEANQEVTLNKMDGKWVFPEDKFNAPADSIKIDDLLEKIASLKQGLVIATTQGAAKRFKVSEDDFNRHIILKKGEQDVANLYLGTSPSFKKVHARANGRDEIVSINMNTYEFETKYDTWLDPNITKVDKDKITHISLGEIQLSRQNDAWMLNELAENEKVENQKIDDMVTKISNINVEGIIDPKENNQLFDKGSPLTINITLSDNSTKTYTFAKPDQQNYSVLKTSDHDYLLKVNNRTVDEIKKIEHSSLVTVTANAPAPEAAGKIDDQGGKG